MRGVVGVAVFISLFVVSCLAIASLAPRDMPFRTLEFLFAGSGVVCLAFAEGIVAWISPPAERRMPLIRWAATLAWLVAFGAIMTGIEAGMTALGWRTEPFSAGPLLWFMIGLAFIYGWPACMRRLVKWDETTGRTSRTR